MFHKVVILILILYTCRHSVYAACTYTELNTALNACIQVATTSSTVRWFFPHGTIAEQAELCRSSAQTALATCINTIYNGCRLEAKSLKMFSITGDNLITAYSNLCSSSLIREAQACMSVVSSTSTFTTAETAFTTGVTALPTTATYVEICGLATTMKYTAYTSLLTTTCTDTNHRAVWSSFYDTILNTYVCTCGGSDVVSSTVVILLSSVFAYNIKTVYFLM